MSPSPLTRLAVQQRQNQRVKRDLRASTMRCIFCGWWVSGGSYVSPRYVGQIPTLGPALRALMNHFAREHGRVL